MDEKSGQRMEAKVNRRQQQQQKNHQPKIFETYSRRINTMTKCMSISRMHTHKYLYLTLSVIVLNMHA